MFKVGLLFFLLEKVKCEIEGEISVYFKHNLMLWFIIYEPVEISKKACTDACNCFFNQIDEDLKIWSNGISQDDFERASGIINTVHYQIIDGHIYRSD